MKSLGLILVLVVVGCAGDAANETTTTSSTTTTTAVTTTTVSSTTTTTTTTGTRPVPSLSKDEIAVVGHSNSSTFVDYYRIDSANDLIVELNQGSRDAQSWGDPTHRDYASSWSQLEGGEPVGGYKAVWVFLGFKHAWERVFDATDYEAWADEVHDQIIARFPTVEYIWWSPMNTYFSTNPGDIDAADLVALDPWDTNPSSLSTWRTTDIGSQSSWETTEYAIAQGYADDYGPWINLTDAETGSDDRHPEEPGGAQHGANILLEFFEGN